YDWYINLFYHFFFFFSSRRRHTRCLSDWSSDVCSSDLLVVLAVHERDLFLAVEGVEGERLGDCALGIFRRELVRIEEPALSAVVPARHSLEQVLHPFVVGRVAAREQRERSEREALLQEQPPLDRADEPGRMSGETCLHRPFLHDVLLALPVILVGKVRGTGITIRSEERRVGKEETSRWART